MEFLKSRLYDPLWQAFVRPPRQVYSESDLGPRSFLLRGVRYVRTDFSLKNQRRQTIVGSYFDCNCGGGEPRPCLVYLHGNSSSRLACFRVLREVLPLGFSFVAFDFSGSGLSGGDFVSLGHHEQNDLGDVLSYLRRQFGVGRVVLWGRSMGAVTALFYAQRHRDNSICALVLDSPFANLERLIYQLAERYLPLLPRFLVSLLASLVAGTVEEKTGLRILDHSPESGMGSLSLPTLFLAGNADKLVDHTHSERLYSLHRGTRRLLVCECGHNDDRPASAKEEIKSFLRDQLGLQRGSIKVAREQGDDCLLEGILSRATQLEETHLARSQMLAEQLVGELREGL